MTGKDNPNRLIVEGIADTQAVLGLMRMHTRWPISTGNLGRAPVYIELGGGVSEILNKNSMKVTMKANTIRNLGLMVDANSDLQARYRSLRNCCLEWFPTIPNDLPKDGLIVQNSDGRRFGAWIMPNNIDSGTLESLLIELISSRSLLERSNEFIESVSELTPISHKDRDKALLYAWLAVQNPPVQDLRKAFAKGFLDSKHPKATAFVTWFRKLYGLPGRT